MAVEIIEGCLFEGFENNEFNILIHCVNAQGVMGSGVAAEVKKRLDEKFK